MLVHKPFVNISFTTPFHAFIYWLKLYFTLLGFFSSNFTPIPEKIGNHLLFLVRDMKSSWRWWCLYFFFKILYRLPEEKAEHNRISQECLQDSEGRFLIIKEQLTSADRRNIPIIGSVYIY